MGCLAHIFSNYFALSAEKTAKSSLFKQSMGPRLERGCVSCGQFPAIHRSVAHPLRGRITIIQKDFEKKLKGDSN
jgi:hypothetical protein